LFSLHGYRADMRPVIWIADKGLNNRTFSLDRKPGFNLSTNFDWNHSPIHDEGSPVFLVVDGFSFEFLTSFQRCRKSIQNLFVGTFSLKNPGCFAYN
jgi:hypothetical protein